MKYLYLVRHAKSSWTDPLLADHERPLNDRGERDIKLMPDHLLKKGEEKPQFIISSTAKRALATAKAFAKSYDLKNNQLTEDKNLYHADVENIYGAIFGIPDEFERVMLFGHNPGITDMANLFSDHFIENVPTCGVVRLDADIDHWNQFSPGNTQLNRFYFPKQFVQ